MSALKYDYMRRYELVHENYTNNKIKIKKNGGKNGSLKTIES